MGPGLGCGLDFAVFNFDAAIVVEYARGLLRLDLLYLFGTGANP